MERMRVSKRLQMTILGACILAAMIAAGVILSRTALLPTEDRRVLHYWPEEVSVSGVMTSETFPGPPGYENISQGDEPETYWILHLAGPVRVNARSNVHEEGDFDTTYENVDQMQIVFTQGINEYDLYRKLLEKPVIVTGTLYGSHTGHHHTDVLIQVKTIQEKGRQS